MRHRSLLAIHCLLLTTLLTVAFAPLSPARQLDVTDNSATVEFPDRITFSLKLDSPVEIQRVTLEYGVANQLTCGSVIARAFPEIAPGQSVSVQWTWEMRQSGSEPPGAEVWWRWRVTGPDGSEQVTDQQSVIWLDDDHPWQVKTGGAVNLHWYRGDQSFADGLHSSALQSLASLEAQTGLQPETPIDLYIYGSTDDMREAILFEPGWTGGLAYPAYDIVIIGIAPSDTAWGKRTQAHELTHVLVGHLTFSCLGAIPTWLNEGLAVYGEGGLDDSGLRQLQEAIVGNTLLPVRSLSGGFSEDPGQANLSYSQSYSLVNFLIIEYGRDKMIDLLRALRDSAPIDDALEQVYGFNTEGFEDAWRAQIGAQPRAAESVLPTLTPTVVPTLVPIAGVPLVTTEQPQPTTAVPSPTPFPPIFEPGITIEPPSVTQEPPSAFPTLPLLLGGACLCALCLTILGVALALGFAARRRTSQ